MSDQNSEFFKNLGALHAEVVQDQMTKTSALSFQLPETQLNQLDYFCTIMGINRSKFIRMLLQTKAFVALEAYMQSSNKTIDQLNLPEDIYNEFNRYLLFLRLERYEKAREKEDEKRLNRQLLLERCQRSKLSGDEKDVS